jgi:hypothetical protein
VNYPGVGSGFNSYIGQRKGEKLVKKEGKNKLFSIDALLAISIN